MTAYRNRFAAETEIPSPGRFQPDWPENNLNTDYTLPLSEILERYETAIARGPADSLSLLGLIVHDAYRFFREAVPVR